MPPAQEQFQKAVVQILEAVMFENWLRFYFITEIPPEDVSPPAATDETAEKPLYLAVPDKGLARIKELYAHLLPLAEEMNAQLVDFETSRRAVCTFVLEHLDGTVIPRDMAAQVLESTTFQIQMQLFNAWVQMHEDQLDRDFSEFGQWRLLFAQWRESPGAKELAARLSGAVSGVEGSEAVQ